MLGDLPYSSQQVRDIELANDDWLGTNGTKVLVVRHKNLIKDGRHKTVFCTVFWITEWYQSVMREQNGLVSDDAIIFMGNEQMQEQGHDGICASMYSSPVHDGCQCATTAAACPDFSLHEFDLSGDTFLGI